MARNQHPPSRRSAAGSASWLTLVAATSLGVAHADTLRTRVTLAAHQVAADGGPLRLIVQSYADPPRGGLPANSARPLGSVQRMVTAHDLARGIAVDLVELTDAPAEPGAGKGVVLAWIESGPGDPDLDGLGARPRPGSVYGVTASAQGERGQPIAIRLDRRL